MQCVSTGSVPWGRILIMKTLTNYIILDSSIIASIHIKGQNSVDNPWLLVFQNLNVMSGDNDLRSMVIFIFHSTENGGGAGQ